MNTQLSVVRHKSGRHEIRRKRRDFYQRYDLMLANWYLLTNRIQQDIESIRRDLHDDLARWRPRQPEPDWSAYANRVSRIAATAGPG